MKSSDTRQNLRMPLNKSYETIIDLTVDNNSHTQIFRIIHDTCKEKRSRILDAGCSAGFLGKVLKDYGHEVWGVEMTPEAANVAEAKLDKVILGTIEEFLSSLLYIHEKFDYIIFGDVLEHLVNPLQVLINCLERLNENGSVIASIPNVSHIAVRSMLAAGNWEYAEYGILDNTHLKFFTKDSIIDMFSDAGYLINRVNSIKLDAEHTGIPYDPSILEKINQITDDNEKDVFQYIIQANKHINNLNTKLNLQFKQEKCEHILCLLPLKDWSVGNIRIVDPLNTYCSYHGAYIRVEQLGRHSQSDLEWADTVVLQREGNIFVTKLIIELKKLGKKIIFDIDDLLTDIPEFLSTHKHSLTTKPYLEDALRMVDAITVTTPRLQEKLRKYNKHVDVIPNCASTIHKPIQHDESSKITLLLGSTDTVRVDFLISTLCKLENKLKDKIRIVAIGPPARKLISSGLDIEEIPIMSHREFKSFISTLRNAIGIIPLDDSIFSSCKSVVKFLDYSLAGIPSICSNVPPYSDVISHDENALLSNNDEQSWYLNILSLIESSKKREQLSKQARNFTLNNYSMKSSADKWHEVLSNTPNKQSSSYSIFSTQNNMPLKIKLFTNNYYITSKYLISKMISPSSYLAVYKVLRTDGLSGIKMLIKKYI